MFSIVDFFLKTDFTDCFFQACLFLLCFDSIVLIFFGSVWYIKLAYVWSYRIVSYRSRKEKTPAGCKQHCHDAVCTSNMKWNKWCKWAWRMTILRDAVCDAGYAAACNASLSMTLQSLTKSVNLVGRDWLQVATALPREYWCLQKRTKHILFYFGASAHLQWNITKYKKTLQEAFV